MKKLASKLTPFGIGLFSFSREARYAAEQDIAVGNIWFATVARVID